jgi:hypothetical protein
MNSTAQHFTATQIARALGKSRQAVQRVLSDVAPTGVVIVSGNAAAAWQVAVLPVSFQGELKIRAMQQGGRDVECLLNTPRVRWQSPIALPEIAQHCIDKATALQRALRRVLAIQDDITISSAELERIGLEDYAREFGHGITDRYMRDLIKRTIERDGGANQFERIELYLDERPAQKQATAPAISLSVQSEFRELLDVVGTFKNPAQPDTAEKGYLWLRAFELFEEKKEAGSDAKRLRSGILKFLWRNAPGLAKSENALRVAFGFKYDRWKESDRDAAALSDKREENSGFRRAPELGKEDRDKLIAHSVLRCGGRVSQAWRELCEQRALSEELTGYYLSNPASKSYCPTRIRDAVKYEIEMMDDIHHGPRTDKLNGAHLLRNWDSVAPQDWLCADDATLEVYFYIPDGKDWFTLTRGQLLLMIDVRTTRILGYALLPEKSYNARAIRTLITKTCDEHGLPRKGFYFESGIWKKSRLLKGDPNATPFSWSEAELGLRSLGLKFQHSRLPRSKPVERVLGALQDLMDGEPGFVGGNEMKEKFERVQRHKLDVDARKVHPSEHFYDLDQWTVRLDDLCERYNAARQDGKMTGGLSPNDAFEKFQRVDDSPIKLNAGCRYLLSHHKRPVKVTSNGITLRFGKQVYNYRNEHTGKLRGETVLAWFNPETPEILSVTDLKRENPFCVERTQEIPAMDAPADLIAQEMGRVNDHLSYARTRYRILKARFAVPFRRTVADANTVLLGVEMAQQQNKTLAARSEDQKLQTKARKVFGQIGMNTPSRIRPGQVKSAERLAQLLNEEETT